jgi:hypothetical protein
MDDTTKFRVRLRIRLAKALTSDATSLAVRVADHEVTITSQRPEEPLNKAQWIVLVARGFSTDEAAREFGERLRSILQLAALSARLGVDTGDDKVTGMLNEEYARAEGWLKEHERLFPNVHGLAVLPDDDHIRFPLFNFQATVTSDPKQFVSAIEEAAENSELTFGAVENAIRLLNLALMNPEPLAQMVLAISTVEELGQNQKWSEAQKKFIKYLALAVEVGSLPEQERTEVVDSIERGLHRLGLNEGVRRLLSRLSLTELGNEWRRLYGIRSGIFHGTARLSEADLHEAANDTVTLCGQIILAVAAIDMGVKIPSVAKVNFRGK